MTCQVPLKQPISSPASGETAVNDSTEFVIFKREVLSNLFIVVGRELKVDNNKVALNASN